jgi:dephospho-CoA kinase
MTGRIVGVCGLSGAGKTTAVNYLARLTGGEVIYFGATVLREVRERGLPETSTSEQIVRIQLREKHGPAYLASLEAERIKVILHEGRNVFVDAVYVKEEFDFLSQLAPDFYLIGIESSFNIRLARVLTREQRPMTKEQLKERDAVDLTRLNSGNTFARANVRIQNERSMLEFEEALSNALEAYSA